VLFQNDKLGSLYVIFHVQKVLKSFSCVFVCVHICLCKYVYIGRVLVKSLVALLIGTQRRHPELKSPLPQLLNYQKSILVGF
jgi:hypothetical protein